MRDRLIILAFLTGALFGLTHGVLMLSSPSRHRWFSYWLGHRFQRPNFTFDNDAHHRGWDIEYRLVGLFIVAGCGFYLWVGLRKLLMP